MAQLGGATASIFVRSFSRGINFAPGYEECSEKRSRDYLLSRQRTELDVSAAPTGGEETLAVRAPRLIDGYISLSGPKFIRWEEITQANGIHDVRASMFLRPYSPQRKGLEPIRLRRIAGGIRAAAKNRGIFHLWWHPHNFGKNIAENLDFLRSVLKVFAEQRQVHGMQSLSMIEAASLAPAVSASESASAREIPTELERVS